LAARLQVSEAALYRHFASKAQMFEGLIEFIETSVFSLLNQIADGPHDPIDKLKRMLLVLLQFAERNPGMARVMAGDALVFENDRLHQRMNLFFDKVEASLRQVLRDGASASATPSVDAQVQASVAVSFVIGRLHRFARSGYKRSPVEHLDASLKLMF
jgi:TetR/AcrR family transcriptional regulator